MSAHKNIDRICVIITVITLVLTVLFCNGQAFGIESAAHALGYENRLFDRSKVHTIDIVMNDWDGFIDGCESEEYSTCNLVIDGEAVKHVGIRAKGNTSLSSVKNMNSDRYSFKIEFDQYEKGKTYHGLDKLCLNNIIQDNTYMKDYLAYTLMYDFGVDAPLCSYAYLTVNGEDWGLYLAVEAIEDSFLERNYGSNYGDLYKPDAMGFGGGRGNGKDFSMGNFMNQEDGDEAQDGAEQSDGKKRSSGANGFGGGMPDFGNMPSDFDPSQMSGENGMPDFGGGKMPDMGGKGGFGMGSDDVKLKYTDDEIDSYSNIFNNAKTTVDTADQKRLIRSLKSLLEQSDLENTVDTEEVIRYFVVHDFLVNGDSYTGQMIHNYYLYEENGQFSMIPWDYNLAYGSFMGGNASSSVNSPIDTPVSNGMSDRPMIAWIFGNETYTEQYHALFREFLDSVDFAERISETAALIDKYVEKDPTKFCTYDEFKTGVEAIRKFCTLRAESVSGQLDGTIPSTTEGQKADSSALIDTDGLNTSDMGSMGGGKGGFGGGKDGEKGGFSRNGRGEKSGQSDSSKNTETRKRPDSAVSAQTLSSVQLLANDEKAAAGSRPQRGSGGKQDFGDQPPQGFSGEMPEGFDPGNLPEGFDPNNMPGGMPDFGGSSTQTNESKTNGKSTETTKAASGSTPDATGKARDGERPDMGGFSPMNGASQRDYTTEYILLGVSALILLIGLGFALKFKR